MTTTTPEAKSLLELPPELRNRIYDFYFARHPLGEAHTLFVNRFRRSHAIPTPLSQVCSQIRTETLPYHFRHANVRLDASSYKDIDSAQKWLDTALGGLLHHADRIELRHAHCVKHNYRVLECPGVRTSDDSEASSRSSSRDLAFNRFGCIPCRRTWVILPREKRVDVPPDSDGRETVCAIANHGQEDLFMGNVWRALREGGEEVGEEVRDWLVCVLDVWKAIPLAQALGWED